VDYRLTIDSEPFDFFLTLRLEKRRRILDMLKRLKAAPFTKGQWQTTDTSGREIEVSLVVDLCVCHWTDHLGKTVYITRIEKVA
jgi:hypothetical protein